MPPRDAVQEDKRDRRRFEKELGDARLHEATYNLSDWRAKETLAFPQERIKIQFDEPDMLRPHLPRVSESRGSNAVCINGTSWLRPGTPSESSRQLKLPQQATAFRGSKLLNSITPKEWAALTKDGAPEAWQVNRRGTKKFNTNMRKELAHISRLRDLHRSNGASSTPPAWGSLEANASSSTRPAWRHLFGEPEPSLDLPGEHSPTRNQPGSRRGRTNAVHASRQGTTASMRPATSMECLMSPRASESRCEQPLSPNTLRKQRTLELLGTDSRPTSVYKVLRKRQPQAEMHMLWSVGPKRFDEYQKRMEDDIASELHKKKADAAKRKLLIKKMRMKMQAAMPNIKTLPRDLWDKFKIADGDGSGRLEFPEYVQVMEGVGLGVKELEMEGLKTLYRIADYDDTGNIDFHEFLVAVVGNLVSI